MSRKDVSFFGFIGCSYLLRALFNVNTNVHESSMN